MTRGKVDFAKSSLWTGRQEAKVVTDLGQFDRRALERSRESHEDTRVARRFDEVGGRHNGKSRECGEVSARGFGVTRIGGDSRSDCRRTEVGLTEPRNDFRQALVVFGQCRSKRIEFLPEGHRHRVLHLGATDFDDVVEFGALVSECLSEQLVFDQESLQPEHHRQLHRGRVCVVGRLRAVDVVNRVEVFVVALGVSELFEGTVGDDLVRRHVGRRTRATLKDSENKFVVQCAVVDLFADLDDEVGLGRIDRADFFVRKSRRLLDAHEPTDEVWVVRERTARDGEVVQRAGRVDSPVRLGGDVHLAERILLGSHRAGVSACRSGIEYGLVIIR